MSMEGNLEMKVEKKKYEPDDMGVEQVKTELEGTAEGRLPAEQT